MEVNTGRKRETYHHGSLRDELVEACVRLIETEGIGAVSLRRVAREAGVSPGAPYHHFPDRAALLSAIAARGFGLLTQDLLAAVGTSPGGPSSPGVAGASGADDVSRAVAAYVAFARRRPGHFQVMFRPELSEPEKHPDLREAGDGALDVLTDLVGRLGVADPHAMGITLWALGHGLASLTLDGPLEQKAATWGTTSDDLLARAIGQIGRSLGVTPERDTAAP
ncbi:TetR/AcrR family transcriptional regulator [Promicromonospora sp. NPDC023987]|uniref:TetR/AcrR family transcriptional regulator n=1 Tax=Promicromonospora sp. NPDC023987 TaxID=3155360 RepID=UPI003406C18F